ncbi:helix-turn-helix transcriptional regulator [Salinimonas marina]|uniref:Helix-turn-helix transcriptional regulator n=1 Tax=Salinimonas marina TaxID=2785918 RepID=A0A7S9DYD7_9ALTE|nr:helix-turn-helix transcriptional regulator [Salinimonas marina]QPG06143.1 helix-turn-helix transcriptional regulator [Salinimonas marina]
MSSSLLSEQACAPGPQAFSGLLKFWRKVFELSQEELAYAIDSSARHISRMENGHVHPSFEMVEKICAFLQLKERDTSHLLIAAGFMASPTQTEFDAPRLSWLRKAMKLTLRALDPYPSVLINGTGKILMVNQGWLHFYAPMVGEQALRDASNHFEFLFDLHQHPGKAMQDALALILMNLQQENLLRPDKDIAVLLQRLAARPGVPTDWPRRAACLDPMASFKMELVVNGKLQRFYSVSQTVGAMGPTAYVSEPRLTINTLYPEDESVPSWSTAQTNLGHPLLYY